MHPILLHLIKPDDNKLYSSRHNHHNDDDYTQTEKPHNHCAVFLYQVFYDNKIKGTNFPHQTPVCQLQWVIMALQMIFIFSNFPKQKETINRRTRLLCFVKSQLLFVISQLYLYFFGANDWSHSLNSGAGS